MGWSTVGKMEALENEESVLFYEMLRILDESRASSVFLENVPAIVKISGDIIIHELAKKRGFSLRWMFMSAGMMGAPHVRKRWFCVGYKPRSPLLNLRLSPAGYHPFQWKNSGAPSRTTCSKNNNVPRLQLLGNAVVPDAARFAFITLSTWGALASLHDHKRSIDFERDVRPCGTKHDQGFLHVTHVASGSGTRCEVGLRSHIRNLKKDWNIVLDPKTNPKPSAKTMARVTYELVKKPVKLANWYTPRRVCTGKSHALTVRTVRDLPTQVKFESTTRNRHLDMNPQFVEWMMGFKVDWTKF